MASTLNVNRIGSKVSTLTIGEAGGDTVLDGNTLRADILKDSGGNVIFQSDGAGTVSNANSGFGSAMVLIQSQTASNSASITFSSGIDSTYGEYIFRFYNLNPATDSVSFTFQVNATDGADYNDSEVTSTLFTAHHDEADSSTGLNYQSGSDYAQSTSFVELYYAAIGNLSDESASGELHLFNPASTTYVKHFYSKINGYTEGNYSVVNHVAGYINDTTAIDDIQFKMSSGNFDGTIKMFGMK